MRKEQGMKELPSFFARRKVNFSVGEKSAFSSWGIEGKSTELWTFFETEKGGEVVDVVVKKHQESFFFFSSRLPSAAAQQNVH